MALSQEKGGQRLLGKSDVRGFRVPAEVVLPLGNGVCPVRAKKLRQLYIRGRNEDDLYGWFERR